MTPESYDFPEHWDWNAKVPSWVFHRMSLDDFPGWERVFGGVPFVMLEHSGPDRSREIATAFDDDAEGMFYYRDWTSSGIPMVDDTELYWSGFWFQRRDDATTFHERYRGAASWEKGFDDQKRIMNAKRDALSARRFRAKEDDVPG